jgi:hypothetical protein
VLVVIVVATVTTVEFVDWSVSVVTVDEVWLVIVVFVVDENGWSVLEVVAVEFIIVLGVLTLVVFESCRVMLDDSV